MKRFLLLCVLMLGVGLQTAFAQTLPELTEASTADGGQVLRQWASDATGSSQYGQDSWGFGQATGEPNTSDCGDLSTAWASATSQGVDNLTLFFDKAVLPTQVNIYQTYNPGSIIGVELSNSVTRETIGIPNSVDAPGNTPCPGVFTLDVSGISSPMDTVNIYFDQSIGGGWNEIDAVELVGTTNAAPTVTTTTLEARQWANFATGTSQYGEQGWSFEQATGEPNTNECGDYSTAWASRDSTGADSLRLTFNQAVIPTQVNIHQTFNPGSIIGVELFNIETGNTVGIPNSVDPPGNTSCPGIFSLDISNIDTPMNGVVIYLDQEIGGSWNEIDAVELVGVIENTADDNDDTTAKATTVDIETLDLTETLSFEGANTISINYPGGWVTDVSALPLIASSQEAAEALKFGTALPDGEIVIGLVPAPDLPAVVGLRAPDSAQELIDGLASFFGGETMVEPFDGLVYPALYTPLIGTTRLPQNSHLLAFGFAAEDGLIAFLVVTEDLDAYIPLLSEMAESLSLE